MAYFRVDRLRGIQVTEQTGFCFQTKQDSVFRQPMEWQYHTNIFRSSTLLSWFDLIAFLMMIHILQHKLTASHKYGSPIAIFEQCADYRDWWWCKFVEIHSNQKWGLFQMKTCILFIKEESNFQQKFYRASIGNSLKDSLTSFILETKFIQYSVFIVISKIISMYSVLEWN